VLPGYEPARRTLSGSLWRPEARKQPRRPLCSVSKHSHRKKLLGGPSKGGGVLKRRLDVAALAAVRRWPLSRRLDAGRSRGG
jgi:hypothetical protein